jgi:mRNA-degrading endonuclease toxin of MazEF toxin-antitoxin module
LAIQSLQHDSHLLIDQILAIDNRRLLRALARLSSGLMSSVAQALREVLDLD